MTPAIPLLLAVTVSAPVPKTDSVPVPDLRLVFCDTPPKGAVRLLGGRRVIAGMGGDLAPGDGTFYAVGDREFTEHATADGEVVGGVATGGHIVRRAHNSVNGKVVVFDSVSFLHVWDRAARKPLHRGLLDSPADKDGISCTAVSPDGKAVAVGTFRGHVRLFDIPKGEWQKFDATHPIPQPQGVDRRGMPFARNTTPPQITHVAWTPDGKAVVSSGSGDGVRAWNPTTGEEVWALERPEVRDGPFAFSPDGKQIVVRSEPERNKWVGTVWDMATRKRVKELTGFVPGYCLVISPDGRYLTNGVQVWDTAADKVTQVLPLDRPPESAAFSRDGKTLAAGGRLFEVATGKEIDADRGHAGPVWELAASADGTVAATGGADGTARVWDVATGKLLGTFGGHRERVKVAVSPDGKRLATGDQDVVRVFDVKAGKEVWQAKGHKPLEQVTFSPDGKTLAVAGASLTVHLYDGATGERLRKLVGHTGRRDTYYYFAWTPDSSGIVTPVREILAVERNEKTQMVLWDAATGERVRELGPACEQDHMAVAFAPDGKHVAVGGNSVTLVAVATGKEVWTAAVGGWGHLTFDGDGRIYNGSQVLDAKSGMEVNDGRKEFVAAFRLCVSPKGDAAFTVTHFDSVAVVWKK
jgi:WD40 repeat protein